MHLHRPCRVFKDRENNPEGFCLDRRDHIESPTCLNRLCCDERIIRCPNKKHQVISVRFVFIAHINFCVNNYFGM